MRSRAPRGDRPEAARPARALAAASEQAARRRRRRLEHSMETVITRMEDTRAKSVARG